MSQRRPQMRAIPLLGINVIKLTSLNSGKEYVFETTSEIKTELVKEDGESKTLKVDGRVLANVDEPSVVLGSTVTLTNNAFIPELIKVLQGGNVEYDSDGNFLCYEAPEAGEEGSGETFDLFAYTRIVEKGGYTGEYLEIYIPRCKSETTLPSMSGGEYTTNEIVFESRPLAGQKLYKCRKIKENEVPKSNIFVQRNEYDPAPVDLPTLNINSSITVNLNEPDYDEITLIVTSATDGYGKDIKENAYVFFTDVDLTTADTYKVTIAVKDDWGQITMKDCVVTVQ